MKEYELKVIRSRKSIISFGAESEGNFCFYKNKKLYVSESFGDLLEEKNWKKFNQTVLNFIKEKKFIPEIIISDLHPDFKTTLMAKKLAKKYKAIFIPVQHHIAHFFSAIGEKIIYDPFFSLPDTTWGIASDGTGLGIDGKIWGGEIFKIETNKKQVRNIKRIGHLENQILIGGELAIHEPARMLISILNNFLEKKEIYPFIKKYYTDKQFELIYNQLQKKFNCLETSSTGRILDAISLLLEFCQNERKYKHEPIDLLERNSSVPYDNLKPKIIFDKKERQYILSTNYLFEYLIRNIGKDKQRLAATAQKYLAEGFYEILKLSGWRKNQKEMSAFFAGGIANNKIISHYLESKNIYINKKIPRGDRGISFGQIFSFIISTDTTPTPPHSH
jgi:hydrogenase maturation protein HypF